MPTDPQYLVRYYRGAYDQRRVKFKSRAEAGVYARKQAPPLKQAPQVDNGLYQQPAAPVGPQHYGTTSTEPVPVARAILGKPPPLPAPSPQPYYQSATYCHVGPAGERTNFSPQDCALIHQAKMRCDGRRLYDHDPDFISIAAT
jgi:hypothetical protein